MVGIVQLVRASVCGTECRGFESHYPSHLFFSRFGHAWIISGDIAKSVRQRILIPSCPGSNPGTPVICGSSSVVEHHLAKVGVASSNLVFRSKLRRHSQVVRHRSATPLSPVQIRLPPPIFITAFYFCRCGGIGRRAGLKIPYPLDVPVRPRPPVSNHDLKSYISRLLTTC